MKEWRSRSYRILIDRNRIDEVEFDDDLRGLALERDLDVLSHVVVGPELHVRIRSAVTQNFPARARSFKEAVRAAFGFRSMARAIIAATMPKLDPDSPLPKVVGVGLGALAVILFALWVTGVLHADMAFGALLLAGVSCGWVLSNGQNVLENAPVALLDLIASKAVGSDGGEASPAKAALLARVTAERDLHRHQRSSARYQAFGTLALLVSMAGPVMALVITVNGYDARYLFGTVTMSLVPLAIGGALLRHDSKVRADYRSTALEIAFLDRLNLALEYAREDPDATFMEATRRSIVQQLVAARPNEPGALVAPPEREAASIDIPELVGALVKSLGQK